MFTDLSIIVVNWNLKVDTLECIDSLLQAGASPHQIVIVDNGSTDDSLKAFHEKYGDSIYIIDAKQNRGYAAGINLGIQHAYSQGYAWFLILNNDTVVTPGLINHLQDASRNNNGYTILTPVILYHDEPTKIWYLGDHLIGNTLLTVDPYKNRKIDPAMPQFVPIDFANGCAMMVHRSVFKQIGFFDESLFMYGEEVDFCWRARQSGFIFACYTSAHILHKVSKSSPATQPHTRYLKIRNQIIFYKRYSQGIGILLYVLFTLFRTTKICITDLLSRHRSLITPSLHGWLDGWFAKSMRQII